MSLLWDCTFSFDKKSLMWIADVSLTDWGFVCRLVLEQFPAVLSGVNNKLLWLLPLCWAAIGAGAVQLLQSDAGFALHWAAASWFCADEQCFMGQPGRRTLRKTGCISLFLSLCSSSSPCVCLPPSLSFFLILYVCLALLIFLCLSVCPSDCVWQSFTFSTCLSRLFPVSLFLFDSLDIFLPPSPSSCLSFLFGLSTSFFGGWVLGNRPDAIL